MSETFIIKNGDGKKLGEIIYSGKKFKVEVSRPEEKERLTKLLNDYSRGIRNLGEVILKEPILPGDPIFLGEVQNQLVKRGYILIEKKFT